MVYIEESSVCWPCEADFDIFAGYDRYIVTLIHHGLCSTNEDTRSRWQNDVSAPLTVVIRVADISYFPSPNQIQCTIKIAETVISNMRAFKMLVNLYSLQWNVIKQTIAIKLRHDFSRVSSSIKFVIIGQAGKAEQHCNEIEFTNLPFELFSASTPNRCPCISRLNVYLLWWFANWTLV